MKIKVLVNFGGVITNERRILPGVYEVDDARLFGVADYLLEHGFAVIVDDGTPVVEFKEDRPTEDFTYHNEIMEKKGRPIYVPDDRQDDEVEWSSEALPKSIDIEDVVATVEAADIEYKQEIEALRAEYESLTGESPDGRWGAERLQSEIDSMVIDD